MKKAWKEEEDKDETVRKARKRKRDAEEEEMAEVDSSRGIISDVSLATYLPD